MVARRVHRILEAKNLAGKDIISQNCFNGVVRRVVSKSSHDEQRNRRPFDDVALYDYRFKVVAVRYRRSG